MRLFDLYESTTLPPLSLSVDNPGGKWLDRKQKDTEQSGRRPSGRYNILGSTTAWYNREAFIPIDILYKIKGTNNEQQNVRTSDLEWLTNYMDSHGKLPDADWHQFNEYAPMIVVGQDGVPYVNEGNHRIMVAKKLNFLALPAEIKYYNGGEDQDGILSPNKVKNYDASILKSGVTYGNYR